MRRIGKDEELTIDYYDGDPPPEDWTCTLCLREEEKDDEADETAFKKEDSNKRSYNLRSGDSNKASRYK